MSENIDIKLTILTIDDTNSNKTSLISKYVDNYFPDAYISRIGVDYKTKMIILNNIY